MGAARGATGGAALAAGAAGGTGSGGEGGAAGGGGDPAAQAPAREAKSASAAVFKPREHSSGPLYTPARVITNVASPRRRAPRAARAKDVARPCASTPRQRETGPARRAPAVENRMLTGWRNLEQTLETFDRLQRRLDRAFVESVDPGWTRERKRARFAWPPTNVFETKDAFVVSAEVPGLAEGDVSVSVEDDALVLRGERKTEVPAGYHVHLRERAPIAFTRKVPLPVRVDADAVTATLKDGLLTVRLPKAREAMPRQIPVKAV